MPDSSRTAPTDVMIRRLMQATDCSYRKKDPCPWCGRMPMKKPSREHITPRSRGGRDGWENVIFACYMCNRMRASHSVLWWLWALRRTSPNGNSASARHQIAKEYRRVALEVMTEAERAAWKAETARRKIQAHRAKRHGTVA